MSDITNLDELSVSTIYYDSTTTNLGLGTATPLSKLSVMGGVHVGGSSDAGDNNLLVDGLVTVSALGSGFVFSNNGVFGVTGIGSSGSGDVSGTAGYIAKFLDSSTVVNSNIFINGTDATIAGNLHVDNSMTVSALGSGFVFSNNGVFGVTGVGSGGGGSGDVSGTAGYIAKFGDSSTVINSNILVDSSSNLLFKNIHGDTHGLTTVLPTDKFLQVGIAVDGSGTNKITAISDENTLEGTKPALQIQGIFGTPNIYVPGTPAIRLTVAKSDGAGGIQSLSDSTDESSNWANDIVLAVDNNGANLLTVDSYGLATVGDFMATSSVNSPAIYTNNMTVNSLIYSPLLNTDASSVVIKKNAAIYHDATSVSQSLFSTDGKSLAQLDSAAFFGRTKIANNNCDITGCCDSSMLVVGSPKYYSFIAMSSDGHLQMATSNNITKGIHKSKDFGLTWTTVNSTANFNGIAVSSDGKFQLACADATSLFRSVDYGETFTPIVQSLNWSGVAMSGDGKYQYAVAINYPGNCFFRSSDFGATWLGQSLSYPPPNRVATTSDGRMVVIPYGSNVLILTDYGETALYGATGFSTYQPNAYGISISDNGKYQTLVVSGTSGSNYIFVSKDYGLTWLPKNTAAGFQSYSSICVSGSGQIQIATGGNKIYLSEDFGETWVPKLDAGSWAAVGMSTDAKIISLATTGTYGRLFYSRSLSVTQGPLRLDSGSLPAESNLLSFNNVGQTVLKIKGSSAIGVGNFYASEPLGLLHLISDTVDDPIFNDVNAVTTQLAVSVGNTDTSSGDMGSAPGLWHRFPSRPVYTREDHGQLDSSGFLELVGSAKLNGSAKNYVGSGYIYVDRGYYDSSSLYSDGTRHFTNFYFNTEDKFPWPSMNSLLICDRDQEFFSAEGAQPDTFSLFIKGPFSGGHSASLAVKNNYSYPVTVGYFVKYMEVGDPYTINGWLYD